MNWAYGVTCHPSRLESLLPKTLNSLAKGGFDKPRLFLDGICKLPEMYLEQEYDITVRTPNIRIVGNWILSAWELYLRNPNADRYVIFQDDLVTYCNLRQYLEKCEYPQYGYWNLYTFPENAKLGDKGWYPSNQLGYGALGLVFDNQNLRNLLGSKHLIDKPKGATKRAWKCVDGGIVESFRKMKIDSKKYQEYVHNPSLVQHTGAVSTVRNINPLADTFRGEEFNALDLCNEPVRSAS